MAKLKDLALKGAGDRLLFDLELIHEKPGFNYRDMDSAETQAHIRKMANAIKENGTETFPEITVFQEDDKVYVHRGHCRLRAHKLAKAEGAPVIGIRVIAAPKLDAAGHALDMLNNSDGLALSPLEQAKAVGDLLKFEWSPDMIAKKRGCSVTTIKDLMKLLDAPEEVREMVRSGEVAARTATDVLTKNKDNPEQATETLKAAIKVAKDSGKDKATPKHVKKATAEKSPTPKQEETPDPATMKNPQASAEKTPPPAGPGAESAPGKTTNWAVWGPRLVKFMTKLRDVEDIPNLQRVQMEAGPFLKNMGTNPQGR